MGTLSCKSNTLLPNVMLKQIATAAQADDVILMKDGYVTEGLASNVFIVTQGVIQTPPQAGQILGGITRDIVIRLAKQQRFALHETPITAAQLQAADEIWLTSSTREIVPVHTLDNRPLPQQTRTRVWEKMMYYYEAAKHEIAE